MKHCTETASVKKLQRYSSYCHICHEIIYTLWLVNLKLLNTTCQCCKNQKYCYYVWNDVRKSYTSKLMHALLIANRNSLTFLQFSVEISKLVSSTVKNCESFFFQIHINVCQLIKIPYCFETQFVLHFELMKTK